MRFSAGATYSNPPSGSPGRGRDVRAPRQSWPPRLFRLAVLRLSPLLRVLMSSPPAPGAVGPTSSSVALPSLALRRNFFRVSGSLGPRTLRVSGAPTRRGRGWTALPTVASECGGDETRAAVRPVASGARLEGAGL